MRLSEEEVEEALCAVNDAIMLRKQLGWRVPEWMPPLASKFDRASLTSEMSASGHELDGGAAQSEMPLLIGTREVADLLGLSTRQVRRLESDLDGQKIGGRKVFNLATVTDYRERRDGRRV